MCQLDAIPGLSSQVLNVETYAYNYPTVQGLLLQLDLSRVAEGNPPFITQREVQGLRIAGMSNVDDFMLLSPMDLSIVSLIVPEKITILYNMARKLIEQVHKENRGDIESLYRIRQEWKGVQDT